MLSKLSLPVRQILRFTVLVCAMLMFGTFGFMAVEGWSWFDGLYMTVITLSTIGYGETHPLSDAGRVFDIVLILFGSGVMLYAIASLTALVVEGDLSDAIKRSNMRKAIGRLRGHFIVCGYGSTGRYVVEELLKTGRDFVIVDIDAQRVNQLRERGLLVVEGDATLDNVLQEACIGDASGLMACLHTDADNLFLVLTAKGMNDKLRIVAKAVDESSQQKLRQVGADGVVLPNFIGGLRLVSEMIRPSVVTFLDMMLRDRDQTIRVEEIGIPHNSPHIGKAISELGLYHLEGVSLVAMQRANHTPYMFNPPANTALQGGDLLILMGDSQRIAELGKHLQGG